MKKDKNAGISLDFDFGGVDLLPPGEPPGPPHEPPKTAAPVTMADGSAAMPAKRPTVPRKARGEKPVGGDVSAGKRATRSRQGAAATHAPWAPSMGRAPVADGDAAWVGALRGLPAGLFGGLPRATTLHASFGGRAFVITTSKAAYERARRDRVPAFVARELKAIATAAQCDAMSPASFGEALERKVGALSWVVSPALARGGMPEGNVPPLAGGFTIGCAFDRLGIDLLRVEA